MFLGAWRDARVRMYGPHWPILPEVKKLFREANGRDMNAAEIANWKNIVAPGLAMVTASDAAAQAAGHIWRPVHPLPYTSAALNNVARPQRRWTLMFPDLRSLALAFVPPGGAVPAGLFSAPGPARTAELQAIRFIQVTWVDDCRIPFISRRGPHLSEWAFEAMKALLEATKLMNRARLQIRICFPSKLQVQPKLSLDSPGIYHLRQIRARHLHIWDREHQWIDRTLTPQLQHLLIKSVQGTRPFSWQKTELQSFPGRAGFNIDDYRAFHPSGRRKGRVACMNIQMKFAEARYKTQHHRSNVLKRLYRIKSTRIWATNRRVNAVAAGLPLAPFNADVASVNAMLAQIDLHWDSTDALHECDQIRGTNLNPLPPLYGLVPQGLRWP